MRSIWQAALAQAAGGLILAGVGGIGYLVYSVPRQLDQVLSNQKALVERYSTIERRVQRVEDTVSELDNRVTRMEAR